MKRLSQILAIVAVVISISGCKGTHEMVREVPVYLHDTVHEQSVQKDSIFIHDSVNVYMVGDTIWVTKSVNKSVTKIKHDTVYVSTEKPIELVRSEVRQVEKPLRWYQKVLQFLGSLVVVAGLGFLLSWYVGRRK